MLKQEHAPSISVHENENDRQDNNRDDFFDDALAHRYGQNKVSRPETSLSGLFSFEKRTWTNVADETGRVR